MTNLRLVGRVPEAQQSADASTVIMMLVNVITFR
jgi:hypothetical protein